MINNIKTANFNVHSMRGNTLSCRTICKIQSIFPLTTPFHLACTMQMCLPLCIKLNQQNDCAPHPICKSCSHLLLPLFWTGYMMWIDWTIDCIMPTVCEQVGTSPRTTINLMHPLHLYRVPTHWSSTTQMHLECHSCKWSWCMLHFIWCWCTHQKCNMQHALGSSASIFSRALSTCHHTWWCATWSQHVLLSSIHDH